MGSMRETLRLVIDGDAKGAIGALRGVRTEGDKTDKAAGKWGERMNTAANYALGAGAAMAGVIGVSMRTATDYYANGIDTVNDLTDLSVEGVTRLVGQTKAYGIEAETTGKAVKFFERNLDEARQGTAEYLEAFERLGFTQEELKTLTDEEILFRTRDAMAGLESTTTQTAIAMQLFGRAGAELSDWYDVAPDEIAKVNEKLEELGLVWGDKEIKTYQDMVDTQREMQLTMLSLQLTIARDVVPALTPFIGQLGKLLQAIRPIMPALPYVTAGLLGFGGAVKLFRAGKFLRDIGVGTGMLGGLGRLVGGFRDSRVAASKFSGRMGTLGGAIRTGPTRALRGMSGLLRNLPGLLSKSALAFGPYALAFGAIAIAVWKVVEAFREWRRAEDFLKRATEDRKQNQAKALDYIAQKYGENSDEYRKFAEQMKEMDRQIVANRKAELTGLAGWLQSWAKGSQNQWWLSSQAEFVNNVVGTGASQMAKWLGLAEGGTIKARPGGTPVIAAEAGEDEDFVPASKRKAYARAVLGGGGTSLVFDFSGAQFGAGLTQRDVEAVLTDRVVPRVLNALAVS